MFMIKVVRVKDGVVTPVEVIKGETIKAAPGERLIVTALLSFKQQPEVLTNVSHVVVGYSHAIAIADNGQLNGIGNNAKGQLGLNEATTVATWVYLKEEAIDIGAGLVYSALQDPDGFIKVTGDFTKRDSSLGLLKTWKLVLGYKDTNLSLIDVGKVS